MTQSNRLALLFLAICAACLPGCGLTSMFSTRVQAIETVTEPPARVTVFVTVRDGKLPVGGLSEGNFQLSEDGVTLDNDEIGLTLLPRDSVAAGFTVLLLDLSGDPSDAELNRIERGAAHFVEKVTVTQPVTVVAFDGSARPRQVATYAQVERSVKRDIPDLQQFLSDDNSRDLNGAVLSALSGVKAQLGKQAKRGGFGTVVTMTRGPDLARRTTDQELKKALSDSPYEFYLISPEGRAMPNRKVLGRDARFEFASLDTLPMRMADLGMRVRDSWNSHYLLSYCSPARAGERKLKVKVQFEGEDGQKRSAADKSRFEASNFEAGCTSPQDRSPAGDDAPTAASESVQLGQANGRPTNQPQQAPPFDSEPKQASSAPESSDGEDDVGQVVEPPSNGKYE